MESLVSFGRRLWRLKLVRIALAAVVVFVFTGYFIRQLLMSRLSEIRSVIDARLEVSAIDISLFTCSIQIKDLVLRKSQEALFRCSLIDIPVDFSIDKWRIDVGNISLKNPELLVRRLPDGSLNIDGLLKVPADRQTADLPPIIVSSGLIKYNAANLPSTLEMNKVQLSLTPRGRAFIFEMFGKCAWKGEAPFCSRVGIKGRLTGPNDIELRFLLKNVKAARLAPAWIGKTTLEGSADLKGKLERYGSTTLITGEIKTNELSARLGDQDPPYIAQLTAYRGTFSLQHGPKGIRARPALPPGGGQALEMHTKRGRILLLFPRSGKQLCLEDSSFVLSKSANILTIDSLAARLLGGPLQARAVLDISGVPQVQGSFSFRRLDAKSLANLMPFPNFSLAGDIGLDGEFEGDLESPVIKARVRSENIKFYISGKGHRGIFNLAALRMQASYDGETVTINNLQGAIEKQVKASVNGNYSPMSPDKLNLNIVFEDLGMNVLRKILGRKSGISASLPVYPCRPADVAIRLRGTRLGPRVTLSMKSGSNTLSLRQRTVDLASFDLTAEGIFKEYLPPKTFMAKAKILFPDGGSLSATGIIPVAGNGRWDLRLNGKSIETSLLTTVALLKDEISFRGKTDIELLVSGKTEHGLLKARFELPNHCAVNFPRSFLGKVKTGDGRTGHSLSVGLNHLKGVAELEWSPNSVDLKIRDLISRLRRGGRMSMSAAYSTTAADTLTVNFKLADVDPGEILTFLDINAFEASGKGEFAGSFKWNDNEKLFHAKLSFPSSDIFTKRGNTLYTCSFHDITGEFKYEKRGKYARFIVPMISAGMCKNGILRLSGSNELSPVLKPNLRFVLEKVEAKEICRVFHLKHFSSRGPIHAEGLLTGNIWWPEIRARISTPTINTFWDAGAQHKYTVKLDNSSADIVLKRDPKGYLLDVRNLAAAVIGGNLSASGIIRLYPDLEFNMKLAMRNAAAKKLANILSIDNFSFAGDLNATGSLKGKGDNTRLESKIDVENARLFYKLSGFNIFYQPPKVHGKLFLDKDGLKLSDVEGVIHGGKFLFEIHRYTKDKIYWNSALKFVNIDLHSLFTKNLRQKNNISGRGNLELFFQGCGSSTRSMAGRGVFSVVGGRIDELEDLRRIQREYRLRNLLGTSFDTINSKVTLIGERLQFSEIKIRSSRGGATGDITVSFDRSIEGSLIAKLDRSVLSSGHRLLSFLEGGRYFDFNVRISGTIDKPDYKFSSPGIQKGALIGGALLFSPLAPAAAVFGGLKTIFGGRRRSRQKKAPAENTRD